MSNDPTVHPESDFDRLLGESITRSFSPSGEDRAERILQTALRQARVESANDGKDRKNDGVHLKGSTITANHTANRTGGERLRLPFLRRLAVSAALFMSIGGVWLIWNFVHTEHQLTDPYHLAGHRTFAEIYQVAALGNEPFWVCEDRKQFITTFWQQLGHGAELDADLPTGLVALGLSYADSLSDKSIVLGGIYHDTEPVIVVIDRMDTGAKEFAEMPDSASGLKVYKKEAPPLVMYEISRLDHPVFLDHINPVDMPSEWIPGHGRFQIPPNQSGEKNRGGEGDGSGN